MKRINDALKNKFIIAPYCEKFEILEESTNSRLFTTATTPVRKINFEYKRLKEILVNDEMINKHLKDHVQSIRVYEFEHEMDINLTKFIYGWRDAYPKWQKYSLSFLRWDEKEIKSLLQLWEMNIRKLGNSFYHVAKIK